VSAPFLEVSPWIHTPTDAAPPLAESRQADVVVVGAGYTGLATALALRAEGADVVCLEQDFAGAGASGRNAGHLTPTIGKDLPTVLRIFGRERATKLVRFADRAVDHVEALIEKLAIDCEYRPSGNVMAGVLPGQARRLRRAAETGASMGAHVRFLGEGDMRERGLPAAFCCGIVEEKGGTLDPGRYAEGLRRAALEAGVHLYEGTPVRDLHAGTVVRVRADGGTVTAPSAVLATNAYTPQLGWKTSTVTPVRVSLFETAPLTPERRAGLGWDGGEGIYTAHELLENYRPTPRGTIIGGSKCVRLGYAGSLPEGRDPRVFTRIESAFRERFPSLAGVPVAHFWGGWLGVTLDTLPVLGCTGERRNLHYGMGFNGHGVAQATLMGEMLADAVRGREHPSAEALDRRVRDWPPEPLRWLGGRLLLGALAAVDARTDRRARRLSRGGPPSAARS